MVHVDLIENISLSYNIYICNSRTSLSAVCHVFSIHVFGITLYLHVYQIQIQDKMDKVKTIYVNQFLFIIVNKGLQIPKRQSGAVNQRAVNMMANERRAQDVQHELHTNEGEFKCSGRINGSCSSSDTRRVTVERREHHLIWKSCWSPVYVNK